MAVVALVGDLIDRSRLAAALSGLEFAAGAADERCSRADVVIVDLARYGDAVAELRRLAPAARIVGFGPHVDAEAAAQARADGADAVLPRSRFFRDPAAAITL